MNLATIAEYADKKGVDIVGTGDFQHPQYFEEIRSNLEEDERGLFKFKHKNFKSRFILSTEISSIYKKNGKVRKIHNIITFSNLKSAENFSTKLNLLGNIKSDGRPILGIDPKMILTIAVEIDPFSIFIPAHIWTPWFSILGKNSGFDTIYECFEEMTDYIFALETGLSSDPEMNSLCSFLDDFTLVSNSDAHSPDKIGREVTIVDSPLDYFSIREALKDKRRVKTVEFYPQEGKYYNDGHRACDVSLSPEEAENCNNICPICGKKLTFGVLHRVYDLATRKYPSDKCQRFYKLVPLQEILSQILSVNVKSLKVSEFYNRLIDEFGSEINILKDLALKDLESFGGEKVAFAVKSVREGRVSINAGFDGKFGVVSVM